jgi:hypothetical protein
MTAEQSLRPGRKDGSAGAKQKDGSERRRLSACRISHSVQRGGLFVALWALARLAAPSRRVIGNAAQDEPFCLCADVWVVGDKERVADTDLINRHCRRHRHACSHHLSATDQGGVLFRPQGSAVDVRDDSQDLHVGIVNGCCRPRMNLP